MYEPLRTFLTFGVLSLIVGIMPIIRFVIDHFLRNQGGHVQSVILGSMIMIFGFGLILLGVLGDIISANRKLMEEILYRQKLQNYGKK